MLILSTLCQRPKGHVWTPGTRPVCDFCGKVRSFRPTQGWRDQHPCEFCAGTTLTWKTGKA